MPSPLSRPRGIKLMLFPTFKKVSNGEYLMEFYIREGKINNLDNLLKMLLKVFRNDLTKGPMIPKDNLVMIIRGHSKAVDYTKKGYMKRYDLYFDLNLEVLFLNAIDNGNSIYIPGISENEPYFVIINRDKEGIFLRTFEHLTRKRYYHVKEGLVKVNL